MPQEPGGELGRLSRQDLHRRGMAAIGTGDRADAQECLDALFRLGASAVGPQAGLLWAEILSLDGRDLEADALFRAIEEANPNHPWAPLRRAERARSRGQTDIAMQALGVAEARDTGARIKRLKNLRVELLLDAGRKDEAVAVLKEIIAGDPAGLWPYQRMRALAERRRDPDLALTLLNLALAREAVRGDIVFAAVRILGEAGRFDPAIEALRDAMVRRGYSTPLAMQLVRLLRWANRREDEKRQLHDMFAEDPLDPQLLGHVYGYFVSPNEPDAPAEILNRLRAEIPPDTLLSLEVLYHQNTLNFDAMYARLRHRPGAGRRSPAEAKAIATALLGCHRDKLGLRYLRACLRRWPGERNLLALYVPAALRNGRDAAVERQLTLSENAVPPDQIRAHRFLLQAYRGAFHDAVATYSEIRGAGQLEASQRNRMVQMAFAMLDPAEGEAVLARIGDPVREDSEPKARFRHFGQLMTELQLEFEALNELGGEQIGHKAWLRLRPDSTVAAIRLINRWADRDSASAKSPGTETIPPRIFQYWDHPAPLPSLVPYIESWRAAWGFEHELYDRARADAFLREAFGLEWARALELAVHPSQEADFLRLCLLAHHGGVYADVDDLLVGDLSTLIRPKDTLVLFREPPGNVLGNNFIAAPRGHPLMRRAAEMARDVLLSRSNETIWSATGPGLLCRAVAHYLAECDDAGLPPALRLIDWTEIAQVVSMHNRVDYKFAARHWNRKPPSNAEIWDRLRAALPPRPEPEPGNSART